MKLIKDYYAELLSLTQLFLLREHTLTDVKMVDPAIVNFFQGKIKHVPAPSTPKKVQQSPSIPQTQNVKIPLRPATTPPHSEPRPIELHPEPPSQSVLPPAQPAPVISPPPLPVIQNKGSKNKEFTLEPLSAASLQESSEWWNLCHTLFPEWVLSKTIPKDDIAQKNKNVWLRNQEIAPVIILSFQDNEQQLAFLRNMAQAISLRLASAQVVSASQIEKENKWETILHSPQLRLVIAGDYGLYLHPKLMHFYRELPQQGKHFLNQTPLLLLSDLLLYLKEPQLKPLLWRAICNEFATSQTHHRANEL